MTVAEDAYAALGEFHDLFMGSSWARLQPFLARIFGSLTTEDIVLDIGAGTGVGVRALAQVTDARIIAVEPSLTMRSVLTARVFDDPMLRPRVTIVAGAAPEALEPLAAASVSGFVAAHMLGHLNPTTRGAVFAELTRVIAPGGIVLVTVDRPQDGLSDDAPPGVPEQVTIGAQTYTEENIWDGDSGWVSVYTVRDAADVTVREHRFAGTWQPVTALDLAHEAPGWRTDELHPGIVTLHR